MKGMGSTHSMELSGAIKPTIPFAERSRLARALRRLLDHLKTRASIAVWMLGLLLALGSEYIIGVGMELAKGGENGPPTIRRVLPAGPAAKAGIEPGWVLLSVNGTNTAGRTLKECMEFVRGEEGTRVRLELADPARGTTNKVTLTRVKILTAAANEKAR
jgi:S1-C subfamily serine protease